jgi:steroid 5-alpha reductase family enzyme
MTGLVSAGRDCDRAFDPDGQRLDAAAAQRLFGGVDTIWTFSVGLVGAGSALWPIGGATTANPRQWLVAALALVVPRYRRKVRIRRRQRIGIVE